MIARDGTRTRTAPTTRAVVTGTFAAAGAVLIGVQFSVAAVTQINSSSASNNLSAATQTSGTSGAGAVGGSDTSSGTTTGSSTGSTASGTFTGNSVSTQFGSVQVAVTVSGGTISDVRALQLTDRGGRSVQISNYAAPILRSEVLQSQTAHVSMVSGATYTSEAYLSSLQSALDQIGG